MTQPSYPEKHRPDWALHDLPFSYRDVRFLLRRKQSSRWSPANIPGDKPTNRDSCHT